MLTRHCDKSSRPFSDILSVLLPTSRQTSFLRACLYSGDAGREASEAWLCQGDATKDDLKDEGVKSLLPLLFSACQRNKVEVDTEFLTLLRTASLREELRTKTYRRICQNVLSTLTAAGMPIIALKGAVLAETVYDHPALRHSHDIDILLGENDPSRALSLLSSLGFAPLRPAGDPEWQNIQFIHQSGLPLALHHHPFHVPLHNAAQADMWARSQTQVVADVPVRTLSPADALLHLCGHASYCPSRTSLRWVCDAWFLIERYPSLDWDILLDCVVRSRLALPLSVMLGYVAEELRAPIPATFLDRLRTAASQSNTIERELALWGVRAGGRIRFKNLVRMPHDWRTRAFVLKWLFLPSPAYLRSVRQIPRAWPLAFFYAYRPLQYVLRCARLRRQSYLRGKDKPLLEEPS